MADTDTQVAVAPVTTTNSDDTVSTGAAPGGGGTGGTSVGGSTSGVTFPGTDLPSLPPQYSTGDLGFFTRQMESVPTAVTVGPDGALYVSELTGIPYPDGYARVMRIANPTATTGFDGTTPSGVAQVFASGFSQIQSMTFDGQGNLYVLEYENANAVYDPTKAPGDLPPSKLIRVGTDGVRTTVSGNELKLGNYALADKATGDVFVAINNADVGNGEVLRYHTSADGTSSYTVAASGLNNPRGMSFGPDGNLYVLESGRGTDANSPDAANAPVIPFIPGLISERGGYTGSITKVDINSPAGGQERILTGLASFREFNPTTGQDRVISIGPNGMSIAPDGTVYIASGGGLAPETAVAVGDIGNYLKGVVRIDGLFGADPSQATITPTFDALAYAAANGPDGAQTLFNTESNLNDVVVGPDGNVYAVDAARNTMYGITDKGTTLESVTVLQKRPPVYTPPQYAAVVAAGGDPAAQYAAEIGNRTSKNADGLPDVPGNIPAEALLATAGGSGAIASGTVTAAATTDVGSAPTTGATTGTASSDTASGSSVAPRGEDAAVGTANANAAGGSSSAGDSGVPGDFSGTLPPGGSPFPGPTDPISPPVLANNIYAPYFAPYFGNYASSEPLNLPAGERGSYTVSNLFSFGDRLADDGGTFGAVPFANSIGLPTPYNSAPYSSTGSLSDGPKWTTDLAQILGVPQTGQDTNFAYESATTRLVNDPSDPYQTSFNFQGQINLFEQNYGQFKATDLVTVTFGGNDLTVPGVAPTEADVTVTVDAIIKGLEDLAGLGAKHFLVTNLPDITLAPLFGNPAIAGALGIDSSIYKPLISEFNTQLDASLGTFKAETGLDVKEVDFNKLFNGIAADPAAYGFANVSESVLANPPFPGSTPVYNPNIVGQDPAVEHGTLFLDPFFNPTALGQSVMAETARSALT